MSCEDSHACDTRDACTCDDSNWESLAAVVLHLWYITLGLGIVIITLHEFVLVRETCAFYYTLAGRGWFFICVGLQCTSLQSRSVVWYYMALSAIILGAMYVLFHCLTGVSYPLALSGAISPPDLDQGYQSFADVTVDLNHADQPSYHPHQPLDHNPHQNDSKSADSACVASSHNGDGEGDSNGGQALLSLAWYI